MKGADKKYLYITLRRYKPELTIMITFPHCKINIGLEIIARRPDGYHDIETVMYPVHGLCDSLEMLSLEVPPAHTVYTSSGLTLDCTADRNIVIRAWEIMNRRYGIDPARIHLHKVIPFGAGLGGGSSDGAFALRSIVQLFGLDVSDTEMESMAAELGSDVPFFLYDRPALCAGRGEKMSPIDIGLEGRWLTIVKPPVFVSTAEAYAGVTPRTARTPLAERIAAPMETWKATIENAFEETVFQHYPLLREIKSALYDAGAVYASMSGSGSAIYGIFDDRPTYEAPDGCRSWTMKL